MIQNNSLLRRTMRLADFKYLYRRLNYWHTGLQFVNLVLKDAGHCVLKNSQYDSLVSEIRYDKSLAQYYEKFLPFLRRVAPHKPIKDWNDFFNYGKGQVYAGVDIFYVLPRVLRPKFLIETGVASGSMSSFLLAVLCQNNYGELFSIDLPPRKGLGSMDWTLEEGMDVGFLIPETYKSRWSLIFGDTTYELPNLLRSRMDIDYFFHDSDHTFLHMTYEYAIAVKHMKPKGIVVSDDINKSDAFFTFFEKLKYPIFVNSKNTNIGITVVT